MPHISATLQRAWSEPEADLYDRLRAELAPQRQGVDASHPNVNWARDPSFTKLPESNSVRADWPYKL